MKRQSYIYATVGDKSLKASHETVCNTKKRIIAFSNLFIRPKSLSHINELKRNSMLQVVQELRAAATAPFDTIIFTVGSVPVCLCFCETERETKKICVCKCVTAPVGTILLSLYTILLTVVKCLHK
jgi:hypothetical protein